MSREFVSVTAILDDTPPLASSLAWNWLGVFWLTSLPLRLLQAYYFHELFQFGRHAAEYGEYLGEIAFLMVIAFLVSIWGRAVWVRACFLGLTSGRLPGAEALRLAPAAYSSYLYTALLLEALFFLSIVTFVSIPVLVLLSGLAAVTAHRIERPGLLRPLREIATAAAGLRVLAALLILFAAGLGLAFVNVFFAFQGGLWLAGGVLGTDLAFWERALEMVGIFPREPLVRWICLSGAVLAVEPFWLAALAVYVHRSRLSETGEDLKVWLERLRRAA